jgi:AcrR family transcriptional regulator
LDAIVVAGAHVFSKDGFDDGAVARVASVAGVSIGSLYQYFPTKDALIAAVRERVSSDIVRELEPLMMRLGVEPIREGAHKLATVLIDAHARHASLMRALKQAPQAGEPPSTRDFMARLRVGVRMYLEAHKGELRPTDLELASTIILAAVDGAFRAAIAEDRIPQGDTMLANELAALIVGYLVHAA